MFPTDYETIKIIMAARERDARRAPWITDGRQNSLRVRLPRALTLLGRRRH
jgi:hypothetical protein